MVVCLGEQEMLTSFDRFWLCYPKKRAKGNARKWFKKNKPSIELVETMLRAIEQQKKSVDWLKDNGQFIPHPCSWLNAEMWEDGVDLVRQPEIRRSSDIDKINRQKEREMYSDWIMEQEIGSLYRWAKVQSSAVKALVAELRSEIIEYAKIQ